MAEAWSREMRALEQRTALKIGPQGVSIPRVWKT
jgi:hypothetical protein